MDLSEDDESQVRFVPTFGEVWRDLLSWEELRSQRRHGHVLRRYGASIRSVVDARTFLFGSKSDVGPQPVQGTVPDPFPDGDGLCLWEPSPHRVALHPEDDVAVSCIPSEADGDFSSVCVDFGDRTDDVLDDEDICFERFHVHHYEDFPDLRPGFWMPADRGCLPPLRSVPPAVFSVFVKWTEGGISLIPQRDSSE